MICDLWFRTYSRSICKRYNFTFPLGYDGRADATAKHRSNNLSIEVVFQEGRNLILSITWKPAFYTLKKLQKNVKKKKIPTFRGMVMRNVNGNGNGNNAE